MIEPALAVTAFGAGLLGSTHCAGMCGPLVALLERPAAGAAMPGDGFRRLLYQSGRGTTYAGLGAVAGAAGAALTGADGLLPFGQTVRTLFAVVLIVVAMLLIVQGRGLSALERGGAVLWRRAAPLARHVVPLNTPPRAFGAGLLWGLLPCGLVYTALALAAVGGSAVAGVLIMLAFWAGTLPVLLAMGAAAGRLRNWRVTPARRRLAGAALAAVALASLTMPLWPGGGDHAGHAPAAAHAHHGNNT